MPDTSGLSNPEAWRYFADGSDDEGDALARLRATMGASYASTPDDDALTVALARARDVLEGVTGWFFVKRNGRLDVDGTGTYRLFLPFPVVSEGQDGAGVTEILVGEDETSIDLESVTVNDGASPGPDDPRKHAFIDAANYSASPLADVSPESFTNGIWPWGVRNVHVTADWGFLDQTGGTPEQARRVLAFLAIRELVALDDEEGLEDLRRGAIQSEQTQGRSYTLGPVAQSIGYTGVREIDVILKQLHRPADAYIPTPPGRRGSRGRFPSFW